MASFGWTEASQALPFLHVQPAKPQYAVEYLLADTMTRQLPLLLLLLIGCADRDMAAWKKKTDADVVAIVGRYREAKVSEVETVIADYLALTDEYERRGWSRYGAPGWIDELRSLCEARLAVFYKATGREHEYREHVRRAIAFRKRVNQKADYTEEEICEAVERLDSGNIRPNWRKELGQDGAANGSQPIRSETNRTSSAAGSRR
jgi:hypothetical protein